MTIACPGCGATRGLGTDSKYELANGHTRRLRVCRHCGGPVRTIQPPAPLGSTLDVLGGAWWEAQPGFRLGLETVGSVGLSQVEDTRRNGFRASPRCG